MMTNTPHIIRSYTREHFIPRKGFINALIVRSGTGTDRQRQTAARQWQSLQIALRTLASNDAATA